MQLCDYCIKNVLKSEESWDYHRNYVSLKDGSEWRSPESDRTQRCLFCWTLRQDIEKFAPDLQHQNDPTHRWNIRSLSRIRESLETIVVTFRQIPTTRQDGDVVIEEAKLPERTFYFFPEDDIAPLPAIEEIGTCTNPYENGGHQIKAWIETCDATHTGCMKRRNAQNSSTKFVPTRLLDIRGASKAFFKVIETGTTPINTPYATLSHCWGTKFIETLRTSNKKQFMTEGVPWDKLTKNFQESIDVARFLGIEYIWIDSLCIVQGPDGDFAHEGTLMHLVYRNSYCNIAIVDSADSTGGAFRERDPGDVAPVRYQARGDSAIFGKRAWRVVASDIWEKELLQTKLYVRGWVFQERMLALRILHFAKNQIFWDCASLSACETLPSGLPPPMDNTARPDRHWRSRLQVQEPGENTELLAGANDDSIEEFWRTAVQKYTDCLLTKGSDKLVAMWGIAKLIRDATGIEYGAGIWEQNLEDQLSWRVSECTLLQRPSESKEWSLERPGIPSWSWASMDGRIEIPVQLTDMSHYTVKNHLGKSLAFRFTSGSLLSTRPTGSDTKATGTGDAEPKLESQSLDIQGPVGRAELRRDHLVNRWFIQVDGMSDVQLEAFPDLVPNLGRAEDRGPFFVVLSAKQVVIPMEYEEEEPRMISDEEESVSNKSSVYRQEIRYTGVGILMKEVKDNYFHRTGAFGFRNLSEYSYSQLQNAAGASRKFWLE